MGIDINTLSDDLKALEEAIDTCYGPPALAPEIKIKLLSLKVELFKCQQLETLSKDVRSIAMIKEGEYHG